MQYNIRNNNIGFLRLLLAYAVIFSHSPQLIDGDKSREFVYLLTGAVSLGELAVNGFFLISGYLICQSYENSKSQFNWLIKRILRIYPAFIVVWLVCIFIIVPLAEASHLLTQHNVFDWFRIGGKIFFLSVPHVDGFYHVTGIESLNGSLWSIRYEFISYLIIPLIAYFGLTKKNIFAALFLSTIIYLYTRISGVDFILNQPFQFSVALFSRLACAFLIGMCFYKYKDKLVWNKFVGAACFILLILFISNPILSHLGFNSFGAYLIFNFSFNYKNSLFEKINNSYDISYGVYIYAWPIQILLILKNPNITPWILSITTVILTSILGYISWKLIEERFIGFKRLF